MARNLRALVTKSSMNERYKTAQTYLKKIKFLIEDVSFAVRTLCTAMQFIALSFIFAATTRTAGRLCLVNCKRQTYCISSVRRS